MGQKKNAKIASLSLSRLDSKRHSDVQKVTFKTHRNGIKRVSVFTLHSEVQKTE